VGAAATHGGNEEDEDQILLKRKRIHTRNTIKNLSNQIITYMQNAEGKRQFM
jgi:hypothetical protein